MWLTVTALPEAPLPLVRPRAVAVFAYQYKAARGERRQALFPVAFTRLALKALETVLCRSLGQRMPETPGETPEHDDLEHRCRIRPVRHPPQGDPDV
jgi:hypothetical protein